MEHKIKHFTKIYPWYAGITGDLLFYIAIDTLFLTVVKNFSMAQIVSLTSFSTFACIVLQFPILWIIQKMGNTNSARLGALCLLLSSIFITFGPNYYFVLLGKLFHDVAAIFRAASYVTLENNLELINKRGDFIRVRTAGNTVYAVITMLISFVAILCISRIIRVLSNIAFTHIYKKYQAKVGVLLPTLLCASIGLMLFGSFIPQIVMKIITMSMGYMIILFIRDPFRLYIQDVILGNTAKEYHQTLLATLEFAVKIVNATISFCFTLILLEYPMFLVMAILFVVAIIEIVLSVRLYKLITFTVI